jgi:hypothetical protein
MIATQLDLEKPFIFEIPNILTEAECHQWIDRIHSVGTEPAPINTTRGIEKAQDWSWVIFSTSDNSRRGCGGLRNKICG